MHPLNSIGGIGDALVRLFRRHGLDEGTVYHEMRDSGGGGWVAFVMVSGDLKESVEAGYGPLPDDLALAASQVKGKRSTTLGDTCLRLLSAARAAYKADTGTDAPEGKWCIQIVKRTLSEARKIGPKAFSGEWRMWIKLERERESPGRAGHAPVIFADYDFDSGAPAGDWQSLGSVDIEWILRPL